MKAAFSDALKRAAVKFGIGRYLYRIPSQWVDYDPQKKQFTKKPQLPPWAIPVARTPPATARPEITEAPKPGNGHGKGEPTTGQELLRRVEQLDLRAYQEKTVTHLGHFRVQLGVWGTSQGYDVETEEWTEEEVRAGYRHIRDLYRQMLEGARS